MTTKSLIHTVKRPDSNSVKVTDVQFTKHGTPHKNVKLVIIDSGDAQNYLNLDGRWCNPYLISETDPLTPLCLAINLVTKELFTTTPNVETFKKNLEKFKHCKKVVVMPYNFGGTNIAAIYGNKIKDGDEFQLNCIGCVKSTTWEYDEPEWWELPINKNNEIDNLLPLKILPNIGSEWNQIASEMYEGDSEMDSTIDYLIQKMAQKYNPPTDKIESTK